MLLLLISLVVIVLMTLYLVTQGSLTSLLTLATSFFASILAIGVYELLVPTMAGWRPDYSPAVMFLGVFFVSFLILRVVADMVAPRNVVLPTWVDRVIAAPVGLMASLVVVGTLIIGLEMLPITGPILGAGGVSSTGQPVHRNFAAGFVSMLYYAASGRGLGGTPLASVHPDLGAELNGIRHSVMAGSRSYIPEDLVSVPAWAELNRDQDAQYNIDVKPARKVVVVRTKVDAGDKQPHVSWDPTNQREQLMLTPTQVRLVTVGSDGSYHQYFPEGYLEKGMAMVKLGADTGYTVDDYPNQAAIDDWVFQIGDQETPTLIQLKHGGRVSLGAPVTNFAPLAVAAYPKHAWRENAAKMTVTVEVDGEPLPGTDVYLLNTGTTKDPIASAIRDAYDRLADIQAKSEDNTDGWQTVKTTDGTFSGYEYRFQKERLLNVQNASSEFRVDWEQVLRPILLSRMGQHAAGNVLAADETFNSVILPLFRSANPKAILAQSKTDASGKTTLELPTGTYYILAKSRQPNAFRLWIKKVTWNGEGDKDQELTFQGQRPEFSVKSAD